MTVVDAPHYYPPDFPPGVTPISRPHVKIYIHPDKSDVLKIYHRQKSSRHVGRGGQGRLRELKIHCILREHPNDKLLMLNGSRNEEHDGWVFDILSFPYMPHSLEDVRKNPRLHYAASDVVTGILHMLTGLTHLHELKIIHRDLKLENVFLDSHGIVKIGDFNISVVEIANGNEELTMTGTTRCMDPRALADKKFDSLVDMWGLALAIWELVTRRQCFYGLTDKELLDFHRRGEWKIPPLEGKHFVVDFIASCSAAPTFRRPSAEMLKLLNEETAKDPGLFKSSFDVVEIESDQLLLPEGLESIEITRTNIFKSFVGRGRNAKNDARGCKSDSDAQMTPNLPSLGSDFESGLTGRSGSLPRVGVPGAESTSSMEGQYSEMENSHARPIFTPSQRQEVSKIIDRNAEELPNSTPSEPRQAIATSLTTARIDPASIPTVLPINTVFTRQSRFSTPTRLRVDDYDKLRAQHLAAIRTIEQRTMAKQRPPGAQ